ncbi:MAG TPA: hypothetical protein DEB40_02600 [Elusimicrobia bacterium]|nr:hypothetical protein [Elusimicrobiota bacterium]HBT60620.1 hypothetical protein [Elusimicrobiota bacterium]
MFVCVVIPAGLYYWREYKMSTPGLQWPVLGRILGLDYCAAPPRLRGRSNGREVAIEISQNLVRIAMKLSRPSRLRVEIGPKEAVSLRAGMVVPDRVSTGDEAFDGRLLARCNEKAAGLKLLEPLMRQRLLAQPHVDILGEGAEIQWLLPYLKEPEPAEAILEILAAIAEEMELSAGA